MNTLRINARVWDLIDIATAFRVSTESWKVNKHVDQPQQDPYPARLAAELFPDFFIGTPTYRQDCIANSCLLLNIIRTTAEECNHQVTSPIPISDFNKVLEMTVKNIVGTCNRAHVKPGIRRWARGSQHLMKVLKRSTLAFTDPDDVTMVRLAEIA